MNGYQSPAERRLNRRVGRAQAGLTALVALVLVLTLGLGQRDAVNWIAETGWIAFMVANFSAILLPILVLTVPYAIDQRRLARQYHPR